MKESNQLVLVYDKLTKPVAKYLFNELVGTYSCVLWSKKDYLGNEAKLKNTNKVLFFDESLIKENLVNANKKVKLNEAVLLEMQGSVAGMYVNWILGHKLGDNIFQDYWNQQSVISLVAPSFITWLLTLDENKRARLRLLLDTAKEFKNSQVLKDFMNGTID